MSQSKWKNSLKDSVKKVRTSMHHISERFPALHYVKVGLKVVGRAVLTLVLIPTFYLIFDREDRNNRRMQRKIAREVSSAQ